jgi:hypothetical protein
MKQGQSKPTITLGLPSSDLLKQLLLNLPTNNFVKAQKTKTALKK